VPLIRFTASRELMGAYANARIMTIAASIASMLIITCNVRLAIQMLGGDMAPAAAVGLAIIGAAALALLVHLAFAPLRAIGGRMEAPLRDLVARDGRRAQCQPL